MSRSSSTDRNRIAILAPDMAGGGAERAAHKLASGFAARGYRADLVLARATGPRLAEVPASVEVVDLGAGRVGTALLPLTHYLRQTRPFGVVSMLDHMSLVALAARPLARYAGKLVVVEQNNLSSAATNGSTARARMMPKLARLFFPRADAIVGVSQGVVEDLRDRIGLPAERLHVIFNPIVDEELVAKSSHASPHPWFDDGAPVLVAAGRFRPQKDFPTLLKAMALVRDHGHSVRLVILGDGPDRAALEALSRDLNLGDIVALPGATTNPYSAFARATAFVLSSRWEGLPTVLIEAMACGAPIVATNCPSGPDEILAGGQYGLLVEVGDVAGLASGIERALSGELPRPPAESWEPYTLDAVTASYCALLTSDP